MGFPGIVSRRTDPLAALFAASLQHAPAAVHAASWLIAFTNMTGNFSGVAGVCFHYHLGVNGANHLCN